MGTRGRKPKVYPEKDIENIIYQFIDETKHQGLLKYNAIYKFTKTKFFKGEIEHDLSEDYWRREGRQGRVLIDKINNLYKSTLNNSMESVSVKVIDTKEFIERVLPNNSKQRMELIQVLKINEKKAHKYEAALIKLERKNKEIEEQRKLIASLNKLIDEQQKILFSLFNNSELGSTRNLFREYYSNQEIHPILTSLSEKMFNEPIEPLNVNVKESNLINFNTKNVFKDIAKDFE